MHLIEVAPDKTKMVPGYEQHTFECSGCHDHVRQLVLIPRAIGPLNSEEMRLSAAWLETLNKSTMPKGDDLARALRAAAPIKAMCVVVGMLTARVHNLLGGAVAAWCACQEPTEERCKNFRSVRLSYYLSAADFGASSSV
jgi:hypothetical protein